MPVGTDERCSISTAIPANEAAELASVTWVGVSRSA